MSAPHVPEYLLWFDYETTGLWTAADEPPELLEMAAICLPYGEFNPANAVFSINRVFKCAAATIQSMNSFVIDMHVKNGLLQDVTAASRTPQQAEQEILAAFDDAEIAPKKVCAAGSGIAGFDMPLMRINQFELFEYLHYQAYDLGTAHRALRMLGVGIEAPWVDSIHRAYTDVLQQLEEARYLKEAFSAFQKTSVAP